MKVFIIGTGNVAAALGSAFKKAGHEITGVFGLHPAKVEALHKKLNCKGFNSLLEIPNNSDVYLLAVSDDAIQSVAKQIKINQGIIVHTSGSTDISVLGKFKNKGVFYPVETIKFNHPKSFKKVPLCLEASNESTLKKLMKLAHPVSYKIYILNSKERAELHLAAVFTNNFTNHLIGISQDILEKIHLPVELLEQLAHSTIKNAFLSDPVKSQTGPAVRNDKKTINKHLDLLKKDKSRQDIYKILTKDIVNVHNKKYK
mgnify:CR=1 FL=1